MLDLIRRDLGLPSRRAWLERLATRERAEQDAQIAALGLPEIEIDDADRD